MASTPISRIRAKIYSHKSKFTPREAAAIMLNIDAEKMVDNEDYKNIELLAEILNNLAFSGIFKEIEIGQEAYSNEVEEFIASIAAIELKQWALDNGYNWLEENNLLKEEIVLSVSEEIKTGNKIIQELHTENKIIKAENTLLKAQIAELETVQAQPPQAVENVEQYNSRERNTHLQIIGGLVEQLSKTGSKFRKKDNPNYYAIADTIASVTADYENAVKAETIRRRLAEAYKTLTSEN